MRAVMLDGTSRTWSHSDFKAPPVAPLKPITTMPASFAFLAAFNILVELPEVLKAIRTSPLRPIASTIRAKTRS